ncbi:homoserine kinase [Allomuricauda sp. SCSIO 65647]|uniref:homoserine kinase n=1 Tax=Allomuricauda sp. SCSIO 65647 TaxID=2908843 RepID=UPI001F2C031E|nr:homoserine kinase [Muricauda sp. SCSIO 65647]UJH66971.1 homoserine kinase [Muricauda sp. SCSIO 65647]
MEEIKIFCPATIANISCGFDVLGLALDGVGDEMVVRKVAQEGVKITKIIGQELPLEAEKNVAGAAIIALLEDFDTEFGFQIEIDKKIKPGSGIGSSAASAAGAVWAVNELLGRPFTKQELIAFAMQGEKVASGVAHADNVAPAIYGGFTLVRSYDPLDVVPLPTPKELFATVIHPQIEIKTADSRKVIKTNISLEKGIKQWGNLGGLVAGLFTEDYGLIGRSLEDHIIEPIRSILIPGFDEIKEATIIAGALGCGISGSGPSIFALSRGIETAEKVARAMKETYLKLDVDFDVHVSKINSEGIKRIKAHT